MPPRTQVLLPWLVASLLGAAAVWATLRCYMLSTENARLRDQLQLSDIARQTAEVQLQSERVMNQELLRRHSGNPTP